MKKKVGFFVGNGDLPLLALKNAKKQGFLTYSLAIKGLSDPRVEDLSDEVKWFNLEDFSDMIAFFLACGVKDIIILGKLLKPLPLIYEKKYSDQFWKKITNIVPNYRIDTLLLNTISQMEKLGFFFLDSTIFLKEHLLGEGFLLPEQKLSKQQEEDLAFGFEMAKIFAGFDVGQTIVVKNKNVIAVEAIEGTDRAIQRAFSFFKEGCVVVKVAKPSQDFRFDVPAIGIETLKNFENTEKTVFAFEAHKTILVDREKILSFLKKHDVVMLGRDLGEKK